MRKISALAALCAFSLTAGCAQLQNLLTPSNIQAATNLLKDIGVELKFTDALGQVQAVDSEDDVQEITLEGRKLEKGKDYKFEGGKMVFVGLSPDQQKKVNIKLTNGKEFKDFNLDPNAAKNVGCFDLGDDGEFQHIDAKEGDCGKAFDAQRAVDKEHRVTVSTGKAFSKEDFIGVAMKPGGVQDFMGLPRMAFEPLGDGKFEMDVQVLNGPPNEVLKDRVWLVGYKKSGKVAVFKFKIDQDLQKPPAPEPNKPVDPSKLPPKQTVESTKVVAQGDVKEYASETEAKTQEKIKDVGPPPGAPNQPPPQM
ncbi:MAG: hypothetical protein FJZ01_11465 [Candidatus Sericytochromatia bacterium]|nr:hypothetical protein [Candidatus Tanganyikabacteria bacterium]